MGWLAVPGVPPSPCNPFEHGLAKHHYSIQLRPYSAAPVGWPSVGERPFWQGKSTFSRPNPTDDCGKTRFLPPKRPRTLPTVTLPVQPNRA